MEQLAQSQTPDLIRLAYRILGSAEDAEDVVQASFLEVLTQPRKDFVATNPTGFLRHLVTCRSLDLLRKRGKTQPLDFDPPSLSQEQPDSKTISHEWLVRLRAALAQLSPQQGEIFSLRYLSDIPNAEIARQLGISENGVAVALRKARIELQTLLDKE